MFLAGKQIEAIRGIDYRYRKQERHPSGIVVSTLTAVLLDLAASPLVRLMEGKEWWEAFDHPQGVLRQNWGETKQNRSVTCMGLKATVYDRRHLAHYRDEFPGP
ncbi:hypothetical protein TNCV_1210821 [Trichonephila clavipes]|nr:hypothetical protein TNCV_1210821 [Trichonephila clavipes]